MQCPKSIWKQWFMQNLGGNKVYYGECENGQYDKFGDINRAGGQRMLGWVPGKGQDILIP